MQHIRHIHFANEATGFCETSPGNTRALLAGKHGNGIIEVTKNPATCEIIQVGAQRRPAGARPSHTQNKISFTGSEDASTEQVPESQRQQKTCGRRGRLGAIRTDTTLAELDNKKSVGGLPCKRKQVKQSMGEPAFLFFVV